jgi:hypothetical protein
MLRECERTNILSEEKVNQGMLKLQGRGRCHPCPNENGLNLIPGSTQVVKVDNQPFNYQLVLIL